MATIRSHFYSDKKINSFELSFILTSVVPTIFTNGAIKVEVGQPLFFCIIGSNKLLTDISIP